MIGSGLSESSGDGVRVEIPCAGVVALLDRGFAVSRVALERDMEDPGREEDDDGLETDAEAKTVAKEVFDGAFVRELFAPDATELEEEGSTPVREALVTRSRWRGLGTVR